MFEEKTKYGIYARKSSESEDRQIQSIDDQIKELKRLYPDCKITKIYKESKSAKAPHSRPILQQMIKDIDDAKINGILCWKLDRLGRNLVDTSDIQWRLQQGIIKKIQTYDKAYLPEDNILLFAIEAGIATDFIRTLSTNTKRGLKSKAEKGWCPYRAPAGYINDKLENTIIKDPERFDLIKRMLDLIATSSNSPLQTLKILNNEWGYLSRKTKRAGGNPMGQSEFYRILNNPFYYGYFKYNGELYKGNHEPMISLEQFERVQKILGNKLKPRNHKKEFSFTGLVICGHCGCQITAEEKTKFIKSEGVYRSYTYYRCTRRKQDVECNEPSITLNDFENQIKEELQKFNIHPNFRDWSKKALKFMHENEIKDRQTQRQMLENKYSSKQKELDSLTEMRIRELINDDEFLQNKKEIKNELEKIRPRLEQNNHRGEEWIEKIEQAINFAVNAPEAFNKGGVKERRDILATIGQNFTLKEGKLTIEPIEWLIPLYENQKAINKHFSTLELSKTQLNTNKNTSFEEEMSLWGAQRELNPH